MDSGVIVVKAGLGLGISTLCRERPLPDDSKTIFDWCKDDNVQQVVARLSAENIDEPDDKVSFFHSIHLLLRFDNDLYLLIDVNPLAGYELVALGVRPR